MESESKTKQLHLRITAKEYSKLQELAKRSGKASMSAYVLECSLKNKPSNEELKLQGEARKDVRDLTHQLYKGPFHMPFAKESSKNKEEK